MAETTDSGLNKRRREFESYATAKANEIEEQRQSWRYYHADQWTADQLRTLRKRGQPPITFDRTGRKIDGLVGVVRKLRTDPKAFPRTPNQEKGAEVATQVIRTICDASKFEDLEAEGARDGAVHGIGVAALEMITGDRGDPDFELDHNDPRTYFYDPRSVKPDFSDVRFEGTYKWAGLDEVEEIFPEMAGKITSSEDGTYFTAFDTDREVLWVDDKKRVRLVDHWYIEGGIWKWCIHIGTQVLAEGDSPYKTRLGKSRSKYFAYANQIDADGDHYGFIRRLKGPQDAMNQHRAKSLHIMNTRQIKVQKGSVEDIEVTRREAARPDGVLEYVGQPDSFEVIQPAQEFLQQTQYYEDAKNEIETFGPNQALLGDLGQSASGRAYTMAQQAGLSELGPFLKNFRIWKLSMYEAAWEAAAQYWTAERMLRVTDDQGVAQFMQINGMQFDEWGQPQLINALGSIDVDIIIDEGPDTESVMGDVFDTLTALAQNKVPIPPQVIIEASSLPGEVKKKMVGMMTQPDPVKEQATKIELAQGAADVEKTQSETAKNMATARASMTPEAPGAPEVPMEVQIQQAVAEVMKTMAQGRRENAQAANIEQQTRLAPIELVAEASHRNADRQAIQNRPRHETA